MHRAYILCIIGASIMITGFSLSSVPTRLWHSIQSGWETDLSPVSLPHGFDLVMSIISLTGLGILVLGWGILWMERSSTHRWFPW
jgi:acyl CoA:acetate/3-ketoacid CoA transferase alpha subunit